MKPFRVLDHDADIRLEVYGASRKDLFENAAGAMLSLMTDRGKVSPAQEKRITVPGNGELLVNFLNELLFVWDVERFLTAEVAVSFEGDGLTAFLRGEPFDEDRHSIEMEMKAVTYHKFAITEKKGIFKATIIIDV
jgi:SHS2 domain-containing protein